MGPRTTTASIMQRNTIAVVANEHCIQIECCKRLTHDPELKVLIKEKDTPARISYVK